MIEQQRSQIDLRSCILHIILNLMQYMWVSFASSYAMLALRYKITINMKLALSNLFKKWKSRKEVHEKGDYLQNG